jgi:hypothetical protein
MDNLSIDGLEVDNEEDLEELSMIVSLGSDLADSNSENTDISEDIDIDSLSI